MLINKAVLYVSEAACVLGCSAHYIYHLIHTGKLAAYKEEGGRAWKIPEASIMNYINHYKQQKTGA